MCDLGDPVQQEPWLVPAPLTEPAPIEVVPEPLPAKEPQPA